MQQTNLKVEQIFNKIEENKQLLRQQHFPQHIDNFLKQWYSFAENDQQRTEQLYVWSMIFGWSLHKDHRFQNIQIDQIPPEHISQQTVNFCYSYEEMSAHGYGYQIRYLQQNEVIIQTEDGVYWINPTYQSKHTPNICGGSNLTIILMTANSKNIIDMIKIKKLNLNIKLITVQTIYLKIQLLLHFLKNTESGKYQQTLSNSVYLLKTEQYFEYGDFLWLARRNCWYEPSFDLIFAVCETKKPQFIAENKKLNSTKYLYYGWKKQTISEQNYQKYTANQTEGLLYSSVDLPAPKNRQIKNQKYLKFINMDIIKDLNSDQQQLIWKCFEQVSYIKDQIVVKKGTLFDYLFILIEGEIEIDQEQHQSQTFLTSNTQMMFGLEQLIKTKRYYDRTVKARSPTSILRISKFNFKFHLFDLLEEKTVKPKKNN